MFLINTFCPSYGARLKPPTDFPSFWPHFWWLRNSEVLSGVSLFLPPFLKNKITVLLFGYGCWEPGLLNHKSCKCQVVAFVAGWPRGFSCPCPPRRLSHAAAAGDSHCWDPLLSCWIKEAFNVTDSLLFHFHTNLYFLIKVVNVKLYRSLIHECGHQKGTCYPCYFLLMCMTVFWELPT